MSSTAAKATPSHPTSTMHVSAEGLQRVRGTESVKYLYYDDMGPGKGHCTWGVGILAHKGVCTKEELGREVSKADVEAQFAREIREAEGVVHRGIRVELTQAQFDALVSFTFNVGAHGASDTYALINSQDFAGAAANMQQLVRVQIKTKSGTKKVIARGLVKRRAEEAAPFLNANK
jgi:lysozyme